MEVYLNHSDQIARFSSPELFRNYAPFIILIFAFNNVVRLRIVRSQPGRLLLLLRTLQNIQTVPKTNQPPQQHPVELPPRHQNHLSSAQNRHPRKGK